MLATAALLSCAPPLANAVQVAAADSVPWDTADGFSAGASLGLNANNPARFSEPLVLVSVGIAASDAHDLPFATVPGYDQRSRVDMGTQTTLEPRLLWIDRWHAWDLHAAVERVSLAHTRWDLFALPDGYYADPENVPAGGEDWHASVAALRCAFGGGHSLGGRLRLGGALLVERWAVEMGQIVASPSGLPEPLAQLYGQLDGRGSDWALGARLGATLQGTPDLLVGAALEWHAKVKADGHGTVSTWVPSAMQWTDALDPVETSSGRQLFNLNIPLQLSVTAEYQATQRGRVEGWIRWSDDASIDSHVGFDPPLQPLASPLLQVRWRDSWEGGVALNWQWNARLGARAAVRFDDRATFDPVPLVEKQTASVTPSLALSWRRSRRSRWNLEYAHGSLMRVENYKQTPGAYDFRQRQLRLSWICALEEQL